MHWYYHKSKILRYSKLQKWKWPNLNRGWKSHSGAYIVKTEHVVFYTYISPSSVYSMVNAIFEWLNLNLPASVR